MRNKCFKSFASLILTHLLFQFVGFRFWWSGLGDVSLPSNKVVKKKSNCQKRQSIDSKVLADIRECFADIFHVPPPIAHELIL